ncbi:MAG: HEAT repeat domain-containing protein [Planctomycetota bacterium]
MQKVLVGTLLFALGAGAGALISSNLDEGPDNRVIRQDSAGDRDTGATLQASADNELIAKLQAELERLQNALAGKADAEANPYPNDTLESIEQLLEDAYAENNVDWLIEVIERLLLMGEPGFPLLRRLIEDIAFKGKFLPGRSEFRMDQLYTFGKVFTKHEKQFIGFLNYLLVDNRTVPIMRQGAMMGAAFYVGSKAPGSDELRETLIRKFMEEEGMSGMAGLSMIPPRAQERMQVMAMAMTGDKAAIPALQDKLRKTKDERMKGDIVGALAYLGDESVLPTIQERLNPQGGDFRKEIDALARIDTPESHETAANFLKNISNSKNFYRHAGRYVRAGGGTAGVQIIKERVQANPNDPEVKSAIGTLARYPTKESLDTLTLIAESNEDDKIKERAQKAAEGVQARLNGEIPGLPK